MKKLLFLFLCFSAFQAFTQSGPPSNHWCGTTPDPNFKKYRSSMINSNHVDTLRHNICVNKVFSVVFYPVADSNGNANVSQTQLDNCIAMLNDAWKPICVSFTTCSTVIIPHHPYNRWTKGDSIEIWATAKYRTANAIDFYLPDSIVGFPAGYAGLGSLVVVEKGSLGGVSIHEMGHYFGLPHTWDESGTPNPNTMPPPPTGVPSWEFVRRDAKKNCDKCGDTFCDTEADPYPVGFVPGPQPPPPPCKWQPGAKDAYNNYYIPPLDNHMSYFKCGCRFTQEQYNFMAHMALTALINKH